MKDEQKKIVHRLRRAEGQLRGIQRMIEEESACFDILTQLQAVRSSIDSLMGVIIVSNVKQCIDQYEANSKEQEEKLAEALKLILKK